MEDQLNFYLHAGTAVNGTTPTLAEEAGKAAAISSIVGGAMMVGSLCIFFCTKVPDKVQAVFQNLSAGIILAAVAGELFPLRYGPEPDINPAGALESSLGLSVGFLIGLLLLFGLKRLTDKVGDGEEEEENVPLVGGGIIPSSSMVRSSGGYRANLAMSQLPLEEIRNDVRKLGPLLDVIRLTTQNEGNNRLLVDRQVHELRHHVDMAARHVKGESIRIADANVANFMECLNSLTQSVQGLATELEERPSNLAVTELEQRMRQITKLTDNLEVNYEIYKPPARYSRWSKAVVPPPSLVVEKIPWTLWFCVAVDAGVDGLLIGLAYGVSPKAAYVVAAATTIEMFFLGLTFSAQLRGLTRRLWLHVVLVLSPPIILIFMGAMGGLLGEVLINQRWVFIGFIGFSTVALLFLVTQELLLEAHENSGGEEIWWINVWVFLGMLLVLIFENALPEEN